MNTYAEAARQLSLTFTKATAQVTCTAAATSFAASVLQTSVSTTAATVAVALSGAILNYNAASTRIVVDSTLLTAQLSQNNFFNVARNSVETYASNLEKSGVKVSADELRAANTGTQLAKTLLNVISNNCSVIKANAQIIDSELTKKESEINMENFQINLKMGTDINDGRSVHSGLRIEV